MCDFINLLFLSGKFIKKVAAKTFQEAYYTSLRSVQCLSIVYDRTLYVTNVQHNNMLDLINSRVHELNQFLGFDGEIHVALLDDRAKSELDAYFQKIDRPFVPFSQIKSIPIYNMINKKPSHILLAHIKKTCHNVVKTKNFTTKGGKMDNHLSLQELLKRKFTNNDKEELSKAVDDLMKTQKNLLTDLSNLLDCLTEINALDKYLQFKSIEDNTIKLSVKKNMTPIVKHLPKSPCLKSETITEHIPKPRLPDQQLITLNEVIGIKQDVNVMNMKSIKQDGGDKNQKIVTFELQNSEQLAKNKFNHPDVTINNKEIKITADAKKQDMNKVSSPEQTKNPLVDSATTPYKIEKDFIASKTTHEESTQKEKWQTAQNSLLNLSEVLMVNESHFSNFEIMLKDIIYKEKLETLRQKVLLDCKLIFQNKRQFNKIEAKIVKEMLQDHEESKRVFVINKKMNKIMRNIETEMLSMSQVLEKNQNSFNDFEKTLNQLELKQSVKNVAKLLEINRESFDDLQRTLSFAEAKNNMKNMSKVIQVNENTFNNLQSSLKQTEVNKLIRDTSKLLEVNESSYNDFQKRLSLMEVRSDVHNMSRVLEMNNATFQDFQKSLNQMKVKCEIVNFSKVLDVNEASFHDFQKKLNFNEVKRDIPNISKLLETNDKSFDDFQKRLSHRMTNNPNSRKENFLGDKTNPFDDEASKNRSKVIAVSDSTFEAFLNKLNVRKKFEITKQILSVGELHHSDYFTKLTDRENEQNMICTILEKNNTSTGDNSVIETCIPLIEVRNKNKNTVQLKDVDGKMMLICDDVYEELLNEIKAAKIAALGTNKNKEKNKNKEINNPKREKSTCCNIKKIDLREQRERAKIIAINEQALKEFEKVLNTVTILQKPAKCSKSDDVEVRRFLKNKKNILNGNKKKFSTKQKSFTNKSQNDLIDFDQIMERIKEIKNDVRIPNQNQVSEKTTTESAEEIEAILNRKSKNSNTGSLPDIILRNYNSDVKSKNTETNCRIARMICVKQKNIEMALKNEFIMKADALQKAINSSSPNEQLISNKKNSAPAKNKNISEQQSQNESTNSSENKKVEIQTELTQKNKDFIESVIIPDKECNNTKENKTETNKSYIIKGKEVKIDKDLEKKMFYKDVYENKIHQNVRENTEIKKIDPKDCKKLGDENKMHQNVRENTEIKKIDPKDCKKVGERKKLKRPPFEGRVVINGKIMKTTPSKCDLKTHTKSKNSLKSLTDKTKKLILETLPAKMKQQKKAITKLETLNKMTTKSNKQDNDNNNNNNNVNIKLEKTDNNKTNNNLEISVVETVNNKALVINDSPTHTKKDPSQFKSSTTSNLTSESPFIKNTKYPNKKSNKKYINSDKETINTIRSSSFSYLNKEYRDSKLNCLENLCAVSTRVEDQNNNSHNFVHNLQDLNINKAISTQVQTKNAPLNYKSTNTLQLSNDFTENKKSTNFENKSTVTKPEVNDKKINIYSYNNSMLIIDEFSCMIPQIEENNKKEDNVSSENNKSTTKVLESKTTTIINDHLNNSTYNTKTVENNQDHHFSFYDNNILLNQLNKNLHDTTASNNNLNEKKLNNFYDLNNSKILEKEINKALFNNKNWNFYKSNAINFNAKEINNNKIFEKIKTNVFQKQTIYRAQPKEDTDKNLNNTNLHILETMDSQNLNELIKSSDVPDLENTITEIPSDNKNPTTTEMNNDEGNAPQLEQSEDSDSNELIVYSDDMLKEITNDEEMIKPYYSDTDLLTYAQNEIDIDESDDCDSQKNVEVLYFDDKYIETPPSLEDATVNQSICDMEIELMDEKDISELENMGTEEHPSTFEIDELIDAEETNKIKNKTAKIQDCSNKPRGSYSIINQNYKYPYKNPQICNIISPQVTFRKSPFKLNRSKNATKSIINKKFKYKYTTKNLPLILNTGKTKVTYLVKE